MTVEPPFPSRQSEERSPSLSPPPFLGWSFSMGSAYQFHSWRVFVIVCALPCVCSVVALTFMPESPRFLLEVTFVITDTQGSHIRWRQLLVNSRKACLPLWEVFFPSLRGGFGVMGTCFQQPACEQAASWPESTHVPPQAVSSLLTEENMAIVL